VISEATSKVQVAWLPLNCDRFRHRAEFSSQAHAHLKGLRGSGREGERHLAVSTVVQPQEVLIFSISTGSGDTFVI
jgi:hypothetical protein